jgi:predicted small lipoprotein YifL
MKLRKRSLNISTVLLFILITSLSACGNKGPLEIPKEEMYFSYERH